MSYKITIFPHDQEPEGSPFAPNIETLAHVLTSHEVSDSKRGSLWAPYHADHNYRSNETVHELSALVYDIDVVGYTPPPLDVANVWHSTHSDKCRLILPLATPVPVTQFLSAWRACRDRYALPADEQTKDPSRAYYLPACKPGSTPRSGTDLSKPLYAWATPSQPAPKVATSAEPLDLTPLIDGAKARYAAAIKEELLSFLRFELNVAPGQRDTTINRIAFCLSQVPNSPTWEKVRPLFVSLTDRMGQNCDPEGADHWLAKAERSYQRGYEIQRRQQERLEKARQAFQAHRSEVPWRDQLIGVTDRDGKIIRYDNCGHNVQLILENDPAFDGLCFNELTMAPEIHSGPFGGTNPNDLDTRVANWLRASEYGIKYPRHEVGSQIMLVARQRSYSPVNEYLDSVRGTWDGTPRIDAVLQEYCGAQGNFQHIARISRKFFIAAVARARLPGCQVDTVLLLHGDQGAGKSSFVRAIGEPWTGTVRLDPRNKDVVMVVRSNWIVELAELQGYRTGELEGIKAFISEREDQFRVPFARLPERFPRRTCFVGSTNDDTPLRDPTGNRRWWPVSVTRVDVDALRAVRDQLWAEALVYFEAGERWYLAGDEARIAAQEAEVYVAEDADDLLAGAIRKWYVSLPEKMSEVNVSEILGRVMFMATSQADAGTASRIGRALRRLRFVKVRTGSDHHRHTVYQVPDYLQIEWEINDEQRKKVASKPKDVPPNEARN